MYLKVADLTIFMDSYGRVMEQAKPYEVEAVENPDVIIRSEWEALKSKYPTLSDDDGEYLATGKSFYQQLLQFDGFMLHSSAVVVDGKAYLFTAASGTGKSTHTGLWLKQFGDRAYILNDDKPALRLIDGVWYAFGTPWSGKNDISVNTGVPVAGIAVLTRNENNEIEPFLGREAILTIFTQTNRKTNTVAHRAKLLELMDKLLRAVPVWKLKCNMEPEAAIVAYEAMSGRKFEEI